MRAASSVKVAWSTGSGQSCCGTCFAMAFHLLGCRSDETWTGESSCKLVNVVETGLSSAVKLLSC